METRLNQPQPTQRPVRLALVITELAVGGAERNLVRLATGLHGDGFEVRVYSLQPPPQPPKDTLVAALQAARVPTSFLGARSAWHIPLVTRRLARELKAWQPDVVQGFMFHGNMVATWASRLAKVENLLWGLRVADPNPRRLWLERRFVHRAKRVVCVSESVKRFAVEQWRVDPAKLLVIPNGIDLREYESVQPVGPSELGVPAGRRILLCVGRLHEQKGLDWLLSFAPAMLDHLPEHDLVLVGDGPQRPKLEALAAAGSAAGRIHFAGFRSDIPRCLAAADALLLPSRWEGMPNVLLEAMASGLPVVATESHGVAEALGDPSDGQMVPLSDAEAFQRAVVAIASQAELAKRLGERNRQRIADVFSTEQTLALHRQLFSLFYRE